MINKWFFFLQGTTAGLFLGFICSYFDQTPATGWLTILCGIGFILQIGNTYYRED